MDTDSDHIIYREVRTEDFESLEKIIATTWDLNTSCSERNAILLSKGYLADALKYNTFNRVAVVNGKVCGIITGTNMKKKFLPNPKYCLQSLSSRLRLVLTEEGRAATEVFDNIDRQNDLLLSYSHREYEGEITLFILDESCRGRGIGKKLFQSMMDYMENEHVESLFLYTDTDCNYGFYDYYGMKRRVETDYSYHFDNRKYRLKLFIYEYTA